MKNKENQAKLRKIESAGKENAGKGLASMQTYCDVPHSALPLTTDMSHSRKYKTNYNVTDQGRSQDLSGGVLLRFGWTKWGVRGSPPEKFWF